MPTDRNIREWANSQSGLFLLCAITVAVFAIMYHLSDKPLSADQPSAANPTGSRTGPTLEFVVAISRHGNRAPLITYPKTLYPLNDSKIWPYGAGHVTQRGRLQMYNLGKKFRSLYNGFLDEYYQPEEFQALSTAKARTLQSAELFLAGLFPPTGFQVWNKHLLWQPVPVFPNLLDRNDMVSITGPNLCPKFREVQKTHTKSIEEEFDSELDTIFKYALPYTGFTEKYDGSSKILRNLSRTFLVYSLWESFAYPQAEGWSLPEWSKKVFPDPIKSMIYNIFQAFWIGSDTQIRYLEGEMFKEILERVRSKMNNTLKSAKQMVYYSGHDTTITCLEAILGLDREALGLVYPGSALILELHQEPANGLFFVKVLYIDGASPDLEPTEVNIPGCDYPCDFHLLENITEKYYNITDYQKECQIDYIT